MPQRNLNFLSNLLTHSYSNCSTIWFDLQVLKNKWKCLFGKIIELHMILLQPKNPGIMIFYCYSRK